MKLQRNQSVDVEKQMELPSKTEVQWDSIRIDQDDMAMGGQDEVTENQSPQQIIQDLIDQKLEQGKRTRPINISLGYYIQAMANP